jgi:hypothetical protein
MPYEQSFDPLPTVDQPACIHLRSKAVYVTGELDPSDPTEMSARHYWCNQTQHVMGPDDLAVTRHACVSARSCYCNSR